MPLIKNILIINGSASSNSSNERLIAKLVRLIDRDFNCSVFHELKLLPHFDPQLSVEKTPKLVLELRKKVEVADGIIICTPEYVFSIPSGLKNAIEWCVSTTVFSDKPCGLITASAHGAKAHEELQLIMNTIMAKLSSETNLLIQGIKGKINTEGEFTDENTRGEVDRFITAFKAMLEK
ncbi:MAG: NAD(P)H-dependent oxidoreductase [Bacteroidia bacterium]|nr:NAD(P)H-dependent oxidoreductase [Bacteroidia bacterium]